MVLARLVSKLAILSEKEEPNAALKRMLLCFQVRFWCLFGHRYGNSEATAASLFFLLLFSTVDREPNSKISNAIIAAIKQNEWKYVARRAFSHKGTRILLSIPSLSEIHQQVRAMQPSLERAIEISQVQCQLYLHHERDPSQNNAYKVLNCIKEKDVRTAMKETLDTMTIGQRALLLAFHLEMPDMYKMNEPLSELFEHIKFQAEDDAAWKKVINARDFAAAVFSSKSVSHIQSEVFRDKFARLDERFVDALATPPRRSAVETKKAKRASTSS